MAAPDDWELGFEEGMSWLPPQVLDEAFSDTTANKKQVKNQLRQQHHHRPKLPAEPIPPHSRSSSRPYHRSKYPTNWESRGSGMQAIFLDSGRKSCGTGVFLPQRGGGINFQPSRKPACSSVLLPSRVVQALNLNVHEIDPKTNKTKCRHCNNSSKNNRSGDDVPGKCSVLSQNQSSSQSQEMFLPKEWTY